MHESDEDARCSGTSVMFAAFCVSFSTRGSGRGLRMERGHQLGQCWTFFHGCYSACRALSSIAGVSRAS